MAASDQHYRSQKTLDIVFAISCILMLLSLVWMFAQDYYRPYKTEQRVFRDVEVGMNQIEAVLALPSTDEIEAAEQALRAAREDREEYDPEVKKLLDKIETLKPKKEIAEAHYQEVKAELDSKVSFYNIEVEKNGPESEYAQRLKETIEDLQDQLQKKQKTRDDYAADLRRYQKERDEYERPVTEAATKLKKLYDRFDAMITSAEKNDWSIYDSIRAFPVLDAFASPIQIHQFTINDVPIDYNFKYVTRFDRCMTCHLGIDRPTYTKENLKSLRIPHPYDKEGQRRLSFLQAKVADARAQLRKRAKALEGLPEAKQLPDPKNVVLTFLNKDYLTDARINEFCAHPKLDIFVGSNSKHPAEQFGCTACHSGQGSGTEFALAAHFPNNSPEKEQWKKEHGWAPSHFWDFPMRPMRFIESSCLKCHYEVTDLITSDNKNHAPKLMEGYNLAREYGCFGCHEISGTKYGRRIGPDLRLEPTPSLDKLPPAEREKLLADTENPIGTYSKVGPSLYRLSEKTNKEWAMKWLKSPRSFRPDTRMPHFYGLSNNDKEALEGTGMERFPDAEIYAIVHYLFEASGDYLDNVEKHQSDPAKVAEKDRYLVNALTTHANIAELSEEYIEKLKLDAGLTNGELSELKRDAKEFLAKVKQRVQYREAEPRIKPLVKDEKYEEDAANGRRLFSERGCLACHRHESTLTADEDSNVPPLPSDAQFGPSLSQIVKKLGTKQEDDESAKIWLSNWIKNPKLHDPRTKMPRVPLTNEEILDISAWLLDQSADSTVSDDWASVQVEVPNKEETLRALADVYLKRVISASQMKELKETGTLPEIVRADLPVEEKLLAQGYNDATVLRYVGKKALGRMGCFGCHDIPGYDDAKPIGTGLNDWGKKDPTRLAFEDSAAFIEEHFYLVDHMTIKEGENKGKPHPIETDEHGNKIRPYEKYFADALHHHDRMGFLHLKLAFPRSYDHNRLRVWDDLLRMPQFRFARTIKKAGETEKEYEARKWKEEAEAREALMTFVLGLVAEKVPIKSVNLPKGDRLAEVKGLQVLEKYNCAGCHQIRPGAYSFEIQEESMRMLKDSFDKQQGLDKDFDFWNHHVWAGETPKSGVKVLTAHGVPKFNYNTGKLTLTDDQFVIQLTEALRFQDIKGVFYDIRGKEQLFMPPQLMVYPPAESFKPLQEILQEWNEIETSGGAGFADFKEFEKRLTEIERRFKHAYEDFQAKYGAYGGRFAQLLPMYLARLAAAGKLAKEFGQEDTNTFRIVPGNVAFAASPPPLFGEGERIQPDWLYQFLLNPHPIRKMVRLRMPQFNLSEDEARALVDYFVAVERLTNPKNEVQDSFTNVPQQTADLDDPYWQKRNQDYIQRLMNTELEGKDLHYYQMLKKSATYTKLLEDIKVKDENKFYQLRIAELIPVWQQLKKLREDELAETEAKLQSINQQVEELDRREKDAKEKLDAEKDQEKQERLKSAYEKLKDLHDSAKQSVLDLQNQKKQLEEALDEEEGSLTLENQLHQWQEKEAYVVDSFRLLANPKAECVKCHQIGNRKPAGKDHEQGPPLELAPKRLNPKFIVHWVGNPPRLVPHSPMPAYFSKGQPQFQQWFVGEPLEQIEALADVLMIYDRALEMPVNRYFTVNPIAPTPTVEKTDKK